MAEVHFVGSIVGASGFKDNSTFCKYAFITPLKVKSGEAMGDNTERWFLLGGEDEGSTQADAPDDETMSKYLHPIDVHYTTNTLRGWPKLNVEVWNQDSFGRNSIAGYGMVYMPTSPGEYRLKISTWRPAGTFSEQVSNFFLGDSPQLDDTETVVDTGDRMDLRAESAGTVFVDVTVILRNMEKHGVST